MKKILTAVLLLLSIKAFSQEQIISINEFSGGVDIIVPSKLNLKYSPFSEIINVFTDEDGMIKKREGIIKYNATPLTGLQPFRNGYKYNQLDGDSYIIANSSWTSWYSKGDTNFTSIVGLLDSSYIDDYTTALNKLIRDNGYNGLGGEWDGETYTAWTTANSTSMVSGRYIEYWHNRLWKCGITNSRNTIYYSQVQDPKYIYGSIVLPDLGGDYTTGIIISGLNDTLIVTQNYHTWEITETEAGGFVSTLIGQDIGCLYNTTIDTLYNMPVWLSKKGVVQWTGSKFNLLSSNIDNFIKDLPQLNIDQQIWTQTTDDDWGAGSGTNIDTTTYNGSVAISSIPIHQSVINGTYSDGVSLTAVRIRQKIIPTISNSLFQIDFYLSKIGEDGGYMTISINDINMNVIVSSTFASSTIPVYPGGTHFWHSIPFVTTPLTANTTYFIVISSSTGFTNSFVDFHTDVDVYDFGTFDFGTYIGTGTWTEENWLDLDFKLYIGTITSASYTSQTKQTISWGSWGIFTVDETEPSDSSINYYIKTSTASNNFSTRPAISITNNSVINSTVGEYIQVISSFSRTYGAIIPKLNEFNISWYGTNNNKPFGKSYDDRYYLALCTTTSGTQNDIVIVYQLDNSWTKFSWSAGVLLEFRSQLYLGSSGNSGQMYQCLINNTFSDDGINYESRWASPIISAHPFYKTFFKNLYVRADNTTGSLDIDYRFDGSTSTYTNKSLSLTNIYGLITSKLALPLENHNYIQIRVGNNSSNNFGIQKIDLMYDDNWIKY